MNLEDLEKTITQLDERRARLQREMTQVVQDIETVKKFREAMPRIMSSDEIPAGKRHEANGHSERLEESLAPDMHGFKAKAIRQAISDCGDAFTTYNVEQALERRGISLKRISISQTLYDFADKGEIKMEQPASGRKPAVYRKTPVITMDDPML